MFLCVILIKRKLFIIILLVLWKNISGIRKRAAGANPLPLSSKPVLKSSESAAEQQSEDHDQQPCVAETSEQYGYYKQKRAEPEQSESEEELCRSPCEPDPGADHRHQKHYHKNRNTNHIHRYTSLIIWSRSDKKRLLPKLLL